MNITGGESLSLFEAQEAADIVQDAADEDVNMIFGTVINPELQDEIVVTVIATGFEDKPSSQGRKSTSTGFGSSVNSGSTSQSHSTPKEDSFATNSSSSQASEGVKEVILLKMTIFLALLEIEKKDVLEELDVNIYLTTHLKSHQLNV